jgi:hypothetical protein
MDMSPFHGLGRALALAGVILLVAGLALMFWDKFPFRRIPLGRLPGDILVQKPGLTLYIPWVTGLVISLVVSLIYALLKK